MQINISKALSHKPNYQYQKETNNFINITKQDCFELSATKKNNAENISFKGSFLTKILKKQPTNSDFQLSQTPYIKSLQLGIKEVFGKEIPAKNFASILTPEEFKKELENLNIENFDINNTSETNKENIYCADLDSATTFSIGKTDIYTLLENVAKRADKYYEETGKKFLFAVTDRDTVEGVQHAVRIIASEPDKFKNLKFIPSIKMSFTHKVPAEEDKIRYENSEMLIYGVNPFSKNVSEFIEHTLQKRKEMTIAFIERVNELYPQFAYTILEFAAQNRITFKKDFAVSNLYWRAREYVETKGDTEIRGINLTPEEIKKASIHILNELYRVEQGSENRTVSALGSTLVKDDENINKTIKEVFKEHATHESKNDGKIIAPAENILKEMMELFKSEETRPVMAISAPYYLSHYFKDESGKTFNAVVDFLKELHDLSDGMLIAFESKVPKYRLDDKLYKRRTANEFPAETFNSTHPKFFDLKEQAEVRAFNNFIRNNKKIKFLEVGGSLHDPYRDKFTT